MTYTDLITRLEGLTEPCRETDAMIAFTTSGYTCEWEGDKFVGRAIDPPHATSWVGSRDQYHKWIDTSGVTPCPAYTASMDDVIALRKRLLPHWDFALLAYCDEPYEASFTMHTLGCPYLCKIGSSFDHPAIAVLIAMFKAMEFDINDHRSGD